jgi:hypothetical protein
MGEAKRRRDAGVMPEKTLPGPVATKSWAERLTGQELDEGRKDRMHLLEYNLPQIRGCYRGAVAKGIKRPIVIVADVRDDYGKQLLQFADKRDLGLMEDYRDAGMIPTQVLAVPYGEMALRVFGSMMTPNGAQRLAQVAAVPKAIPVVVIANHGNFYAGVSEEK